MAVTGIYQYTNQPNNTKHVMYYQQAQIVRQFQCPNRISRNSGSYSFTDIEGNAITLPIEGTIIEVLKEAQ